MRNYSAVYGKLGAIRDRFLNIKDLDEISSMQTFSAAVNYLSNRKFIESEEESPRSIERKLRERFLSKVGTFLFYLPDTDRNFLEFFLYKYDIYNLKILLALHFSDHDKQTTEFVYHNTPLFKRYAFLMDREHLVDKDILLAFQGSRIFPFLMHTYRSYKETGDLFFLDTVLEDAYYQKLLAIAYQEKRLDLGLFDLLKHFLLVHNLMWGIRMHFIYKLRKEKIYYYLVLPLPGISTNKLLSLFEHEQVEEFKRNLLEFISRCSKFVLEPSLEVDLEKIKEALLGELLIYLFKASKDVAPYSLRGIVGWILVQEMLADKISFILYERFLKDNV